MDLHANAVLTVRQRMECPRFRGQPSAGTARHLCARAGLTSTVRSSEGRARLGHISQQGSPHVRWALVEAARKAATGGGPLRASFKRIAKRRGRNIAKVAIARKMLTLCYYGLRDGEIRCLQAPGPASPRRVKAAP